MVADEHLKKHWGMALVGWVELVDFSPGVQLGRLRCTLLTA
jgi:hypothetical protein